MLIPQHQTPAEIMDKVNALFKSANSLSVHLDVNHFRYTSPGSGDLRMLRPNDFLFSYKIGDHDYSYSASDEGVVEIERSDMTYSTWPANVALISPESRFSDMIAAGFPSLFHSAWVISNKWPNFEYKGSDLVNGERADHLYRVDPGSGIYDFWIGSDGRILRYQVSDGAGSTIKYTFSNYRFNQPLKVADLHTPLPRGSSPYALPDVEEPLGLGKPFPVEGWTSATNQGNLSNGKPVLVVVVDEESDASALMADSLRALSSSVPIAIVKDNASGNVPAPLASFPIYSDPTGNLIQKLSFPGTPMVYLVDAHGAVSKLWLGYSPADRPAFEAHILSGLKK